MPRRANGECPRSALLVRPPLPLLSGSWVDSHTLENDSESLGMVKSLRIAIIPTRLGRLCLNGVVRAGKNGVCGNESGSTVACRRVPSWRGCTRSTSMRFTGTVSTGRA